MNRKNYCFLILSFCLSFFVLLLVSQYSIANDAEFHSGADTIFPLQENNISLEKEILKIKQLENTWNVDVYFEFFNPGEAKELLIGFVTPPPEGDPGPEESWSQKPLGYGITDFQVKVNNYPVD